MDEDNDIIGKQVSKRTLSLSLSLSLKHIDFFNLKKKREALFSFFEVYLPYEPVCPSSIGRSIIFPKKAGSYTSMLLSKHLLEVKLSNNLSRPSVG